MVWICNIYSHTDKTVPVSAFPAWDPDIRTFLEIGKAEHIGHEALLLAVAAGNSQYVLSLVIPAQQKMTEILISIHNKAVTAEAAVFSA